MPSKKNTPNTVQISQSNTVSCNKPDDSVPITDETEFKKKYNLLCKELGVFKKDEIKLITNMCSRTLSSLKELLVSHNAEIRCQHSKKHKHNGNRPPSGFNKPSPVPEKLAKFIGVKPGEELTRPQITSKIWKQFHTRHLTLDADKGVLRVDTEISDLFKIPMSVNDIKDRKDTNGLNFKTLPKYIKNAFLPAPDVTKPKVATKKKL